MNTKRTTTGMAPKYYLSLRECMDPTCSKKHDVVVGSKKYHRVRVAQDAQGDER